MRAFLYTQFVGSVLGFLIGLATLGTTTWPRIKSESQVVYIIRVFFTVVFGAWEAWLLWGPK